MGRDIGKLIEFKRELFQGVRIEATPGEFVPYVPHDGQRDIHFDPAWRYYVVSAGQRSGKTLAAAMECISYLTLPGSRTWILGPNYGLADKTFAFVYDLVVRQGCLGPGAVEEKSFTKDRRWIRMSWGAWIEVKTAENPDSLVGEQLDFVVMDEAARISTSKIWEEMIRPRLVNRQGRALMISSPRGYNWFGGEYLNRGDDPEFYERGWRRAVFATGDNPYVAKEELDLIKAEVSEEVWNQEYLGIPQRFSGLIWPEYRDTLYKPESPGSGGHLYDPAEAPNMEGWTHYRAIDVGYRHPTFCLWSACEPQTNDLYFYREYSEQNIVHEDHAENIAALTSYPIRTTWISPDAKRKNQITRKEERLCAWDVYRKAGVVARPAHDDVRVGLSLVAQYMRSTLQDAPDNPRLFISKDLGMLRSSIKEYVFADYDNTRDIDPPDKPKKYKDDGPDTLRYMVAGRPRFISTARMLEPPEIDRPSNHPARAYVRI